MIFPGEKNLYRSFASVSPVFVALGLALCVAPTSAARARAESSGTATTVKRQSATTQFARAEEQREQLNSKPSEKRTLSDYKQVVSSYRRVALITPRAPQVPDSLLAVAEVYTEMGDRFGRSYYQSAADSYQFLVREYPKSKYCQDAILRIAKLQRDRLGDAELAKKTYEDFLKRYPRSPRKREAQESLAELALLQNSEASSSALTAAANSAGPPGFGTWAVPASLAAMSGSAATVLLSLPILSRNSPAMPRGPNTPTKPSTSSAGKPASIAVGISGRIGARWRPFTTNVLMRPACVCGCRMA